MSNHIDPKVEGIKRNHENAQRGLEKFDKPFITQEHQDRAYLLSEYKRLQGLMERAKDTVESLYQLTQRGELNSYDIKEADRTYEIFLSHLKGE